LSDVEQRLLALETAEAARTTLARYADAVDAQSVSGIEELLAPDVVLDVGAVFEGRAAVTEFFRKAFADDPSDKSHFITNVRVSSVGTGRAKVDAYFLYTAAADTTSIIGWGTYAHEVAVAPEGEGLFTRMSLGIRRSVDVRNGWTTEAAS
jgi:hypothetical protein